MRRKPQHGTHKRDPREAAPKFDKHGWPSGPADPDRRARAALIECYLRVVREGAAPDAAIAQWHRGARHGLPESTTPHLKAALLALLKLRFAAIIPAAFLLKGEEHARAVAEAIAPLDLSATEEAQLVLAVALLRGKSLGADTVRSRTGILDSTLQLAKGAHEGVPAMPRDLADAACASLPLGVWTRWRLRYGLEEALALAAAFAPAPQRIVRINRGKTDRERALDSFRKAGVAAESFPELPDAIAIDPAADLFDLPALKFGEVEIHDAASQLAAIAVSPSRNDRVLDACAGSGGKSLHLASLLGNRGEVLAHDIRTDRQSELQRRADRAGARCIRILGPNDAPAHGPFDAVLVDAPCLGFGTLRQNPDYAWRGRLQLRVPEIAERQRECIRAYAPLVAKGGVLVYAICSFEPEEIEAATDTIAHEFPQFTPEPLGPIFAAAGVHRFADARAALTILPHRFHGSGFFLARWRNAT